MNAVLEKQAVSPSDQMVFCPLQFRHVPLERCLECSRLVRVDDRATPRFVVCDASLIDRR